jgi:hypothetical protein
MKTKPRRAIKIVGTDQILELSKVTAVKLNGPEMIHFDKLPDGTWRLIYNSNMIPDFTQVQAFEMIRED